MYAKHFLKKGYSYSSVICFDQNTSRLMLHDQKHEDTLPLKIECRRWKYEYPTLTSLNDRHTNSLSCSRILDCVFGILRYDTMTPSTGWYIPLVSIVVLSRGRTDVTPESVLLYSNTAVYVQFVRSVPLEKDVVSYKFAEKVGCVPELRIPLTREATSSQGRSHFTIFWTRVLLNADARTLKP